MPDPAPQPAPDYETIYDVEGALEPALKTVLLGISVPCATPRGIVDLAPVRVDAQLQLGQELDTRARDNLGRLLTNAWRAQFLLRITTPRFGQPDADGNPLAYDPTAHGRLRAKIRYHLQNWLNAFPSTVLPYHVLTQIMAAGSSPQLEAEEDQDTCELAYDCIISIRQGAWPAAV